MHKDLLSLRVHRQIGNWTEYRERHPNSDKLTHSAMNAPPFSNSLPTRGEKEKGREREREREREEKEEENYSNIAAVKLARNAASQKIRGR